MIEIFIIIVIYVYVSLLCAALGHAIKNDLNFFTYLIVGLIWPLVMIFMINDVKDLRKGKINENL